MIAAPILLAAAQVLTLAQAEANTRQNLPAIHLAIAQTAAAQAVRDQARDGYLPQLSGSAAFYPIQLGTGGQAIASGATLPAGVTPATVIAGQTATFGARATQLIYDFNQTIDRIKSNDALVVAQRENEVVIWNGVVLTTRTAYFNCQQNFELIRVAKENLDDQNQHVDEMAAFVKVGTHTEVDLAQAQQQAAAAMYQLIQAQGSYRLSIAALQQAMGIDAPPDYDVNTDVYPSVAGEEQTTDALLPEALNARPEVRNLIDQINAQRLALSYVREGWTPTLSAVGTAGGNWAEWEKASTTTPYATLGVALSWPFWLGGTTQDAARQQDAILVQLQAQMDAEKQQVRNDVDSARIAIATAKSELDSAQQALVYAKEQLKLADAQYKAGVGIALAVFDAETAVFTAGGQVAQSVDALAVARAQLIRALGRAKY